VTQLPRLYLSLHDGADDLNGEARSPWSTRSQTGLNGRFLASTPRFTRSEMS